MEPLTAIRLGVKQVRRRLYCMAFLRWLPAMLTIAFAILLIALCVPKLWPLPWNPIAWVGSWLVGSVLLGLVAAWVATYLERPTLLGAATAIDRRSHLKERVSSALLLSESERMSPIGSALVQDAQRRMAHADVLKFFPLGLSWRHLLPIVPLLLAGVVFTFVPDVAQLEAAATQAAKDIEPKATVLLKQQLAAQKKQLQEQGLADATKLLTSIEKRLEEEKGEPGKGNRKSELIKLNDVAKLVRERQQQIGDLNELKKRLQKMEGFSAGPAERIQKAIQNGDFKEATKALRGLKDQLQDGKLNEQQKQQLKQQLEQLAKNLEDLAKKQAQAREQLEQERDKAQKAGDFAKAGMVQDQLDKMKAMDGPCKAAGKLAEQMQNAKKAMEQGNGKQAANALTEMEKQLNELTQSESELKSLESTLEQLSDAKSSMQCEQCQGSGCEACQQPGDIGMAKLGDGKGEGEGDGLGEGQGKGKRPESENETKSYDSQVRGTPGQGKSVQVGTAGGENLPGESLEEVRQAVQAAELKDEDPLTNVRLPRAYRDQVQEYFDAVREGK